MSKPSKSTSGGGGGGGNNNNAPRLKVIVRRLPADLPESIFWKSVEPWIIREVLPLQEIDEASGSNSSSGEVNGKNVKAERVVWSCFKSGKVRRSGKDKDDVHSRAYISFKTLEGLMAFSKGYDGWSFRDKNGNTSQAVVEFAPYQKIPVIPTKLDTKRQGGIEEDPDYINFLQILATPEPLKTDDTSSSKKEVPKTTPLLDHLRAQKAIDLASRKNPLASTSKVTGSRSGRQSSKSSKTTSSGGTTTSGSNGGSSGKTSRKGKESSNSGTGRSGGGGGGGNTGVSGGSGSSKKGRGGNSRSRGGVIPVVIPVRPTVPPPSAFPSLSNSNLIPIVPLAIHHLPHPIILPPLPQQQQQQQKNQRASQILQVQSQIRSGQIQVQQQINQRPTSNSSQIQNQQQRQHSNQSQKSQQQQQRQPQIQLLARPTPRPSSSSFTPSQLLNPPPISNQLIPPLPPSNQGGGGRRGQQNKPDGAVAGQRRALGAALGAALGGGGGGGGNRKRRGPQAGNGEQPEINPRGNSGAGGSTTAGNNVSGGGGSRGGGRSRGGGGGESRVPGPPPA